MKGLTTKEQQIVDAIINYTSAYGYSPSMKELLPTTGVTSTSSMYKYIQILKTKGALKSTEKECRTFQVVGYGYVDCRSEEEKQIPGETYARTLEAISNFLLTKGYPPSMRNLCNATGLKSTSTIYAHLDYLQRMQKITLRGNSSRAIVVNGIIYQRLEESI